MGIVVKNIIPRKFAENAQTSQYTALNCKIIIDKFTVTNTSGSNVTFSVNLVATGDAAAASNLILASKSIAPNQTYTCPEIVGQTLEPNGYISTLASVASALTISSSGREIT